MKGTFLPFFFLSTLFLNYGLCKTILRLYADDKELPPSPDYRIYAPASGAVFKVAAPTGFSTKVAVDASYFDLQGREILRVKKTVETGETFKVARDPKATSFRAAFEPEEPALYAMANPLVTADFESFPIERLIPDEEQAAVAREFAVSGKLNKLTKN